MFSCGGLLEGRISVNCQGTCIKKTPSACPSLVDMSALTEVVESFVKFARDFGQCMIEEVVEPYLEAQKLSEDTLFPSRVRQQLAGAMSCGVLLCATAAAY